MENGACIERNPANDVENDFLSNVQHPSVFEFDLSENRKKKLSSRTFKKNLTEKNEENSKNNNDEISSENYKNSLASPATLDENKTVFEP